MARQPDNMPPVQEAYTTGDQYGAGNTVATGGVNSIDAIRGRNYKHFMDREEQVQTARRYMQTRGVPMTQKNLLSTMAWLSGDDSMTANPSAPTGVDAAMATVDAGDAGMRVAPQVGGGGGSPASPSPPTTDTAPPVVEGDDTGGLGIPLALPGAVVAGGAAARAAGGARRTAEALDERGRTIDPLTGDILDAEVTPSNVTNAPRIEGPVIDGTATGTSVAPVAQAGKAGSRNYAGSSGAAQIGGRGEGGMLTESEARTALSNARSNPGETYDIGNGSSLMTTEDGTLLLNTPAGHMALDADESIATGQLREALRALQRM